MHYESGWIVWYEIQEKANGRWLYVDDYDTRDEAEATKDLYIGLHSTAPLRVTRKMGLPA